LVPEETARHAGLAYVSDAQPGIRRLRVGRGFTYVAATGRPIRDVEQLKRIKSLVIPPAWSDVWICSSPRGHLQATGRDARGRKQYRYHANWTSVRNETKYERLAAFGEELALLRDHVDADLRGPALSRRRVIAAVIRLLDEGLIRVGNEEYVRQNGSYGLTTLRMEHVDVCGQAIRFRFRGKSGKEHELAVSDPRVARVVRRCQELPGHELFQYTDEEGTIRRVDSADVNAYLQEATGGSFTSKDFRTWGASVVALDFLLRAEPPESAADANRKIVDAIKHTAERLGNTPAVCKRCYVHPDILEAYQCGSLADLDCRSRTERGRKPANLSGEERRLLRFLREANG
jgi:DNA topoisomerase-1